MTSIRDDLPTLEQVLTRQTLPPVCLYNFYIIMRDRLHMEEVLDFYLDVQHHEQLWRRYVRSMRRSGYLTEDDLAEGFQSPHVLSRLSQLDEKWRPLSTMSTSTNEKLQQLQQPSPLAAAGGGVRIDDELNEEDEVQLEQTSTSQGEDPRQTLLKRRDLTESAQRILLKYLVPAASKELTQIPPELKATMRREMEENGRDDPLVFHDAKEYLFEYMRRGAYPKFLRLKVWGNLTLWQQLGRLVLGLLALLAGFTTAFSLIFLGFPRWGTRFWILLPLWVGVLNILCFLTGLDPLWVILFNRSETTTFHFNKIQQQPVKRILWWRSIWLLALSIIIAMVLTIIFAGVPSHRL